MPEDLKLSQIGSSPLPTPFRGLHSPGVQKHCQIIFACYFRKSSIISQRPKRTEDDTYSWLFIGITLDYQLGEPVKRLQKLQLFPKTIRAWNNLSLPSDCPPSPPTTTAPPDSPDLHWESGSSIAPESATDK